MALLCLLPALTFAAPSRLAMTYVHHNEPEWPTWGSEPAYLAYRAKMVDLVEGLVARGVAIDLQVCGEMLVAEERWGGGEHVLAYLLCLAPNLVAVAPHGHDDTIGPGNPFNTADAAYLLHQAGLINTGVARTGPRSRE